MVDIDEILAPAIQTVWLQGRGSGVAAWSATVIF